MDTTELATLSLANALMISRIVHDLKTPLFTIRLNQDLFFNELPTLINAYQVATEHKLVPASINEVGLKIIKDAPGSNNEVLNKAGDFLNTLVAFGNALQ